MPDDIQPTGPAVELVGVTEPFDGLDVSPTEEPTQSSEAATQGVQYVTKQDFEAMQALLLQQVERTAQSYADKTASRLDKRVKEELTNLNRSIETLKASGMAMTDEQVKAARQTILDKVLLENDGEPTPPPAPNSPPPSGTQGGPVDPTAQMNAVFVQTSMQKLNAQHGITLDPTDPEAEGMGEIQDPFEFVAKYQEGIAKKAQRVAIPPQARVTTAVSGASKPLTTLDSLTAELNRLVSRPRLEDLSRIQELQREISKVRGS